tara:strand:+ start:30 stop:917 length:888 start_codon:yes stop_codon:yes gene_type:complete
MKIQSEKNLMNELSEKNKKENLQKEEIVKLKSIISHMDDGEGVCDFIDDFVKKDQETVTDIVARNTIMEKKIGEDLVTKLDLYHNVLKLGMLGVDSIIENTTIKELRTFPTIESTITIKYLKDYINTLYDAYSEEGKFLIAKKQISVCKQYDREDGVAGQQRTRVYGTFDGGDGLVSNVASKYIVMTHHIDDETTKDNIDLFISMIMDPMFHATGGRNISIDAVVIKPDKEFTEDIVNIDDIWWYPHRHCHSECPLKFHTHQFKKSFRQSYKCVETSLSMGSFGQKIRFTVREVE